MTEAFFGILFVLLIATVVGHGIWVALASLGRKLFGEPTQPTSRPNAADPEVAIRQVNRAFLDGKIPPPIHLLVVRLLRGGKVMPQEWVSAAETLAAVSTKRQTPISATVLDAGSAVENRTAISQSSLSSIPESEIVDAVVISEPPAAVPLATPLISSPYIASLDIESPEFSPNVQPAAARAVEVSRKPHPLNRDVLPAAPPQQRMKQVLQAFMEEKNIRWGEIISGLLIIVCAVGLVVSLWSTLRDAIPYMPALIFMVGTAAFHAAGIYTLRKWQLRSVSRAVLVIATLLIPLNFLAAAALSGRDNERVAVTDPIYLLAIAVGLIAYTAMAYFSGRALVPVGWPRLIVAVMGASVGQLFINRLGHSHQNIWESCLLIALPALSVAGALAWQVASIKRRRLSQRLGVATLMILGLALFSFSAAVALLILKTQALRLTLSQLSPLLSVICGAVLITGLTLRQRSPAKLSTLRMTGDAIAILGSFLLLLSVYLAWPRPALLVAVGTVNALLLGCMAVTSTLPILLAPAVFCATLAALVGARLYRGDISLVEPPISGQLVQSMLDGVTSVELTIAALIASVVAGGLARLRRAADVHVLLASAAALGAASILIATRVGFFDGTGANLAAPVFLLYAIALLVAALIAKQPVVGWMGSGLLLAAMVQAMIFNTAVKDWISGRGFEIRRPFLSALLLHANLTIILAAAVGRAAAWKRSDSADRATWKGFVDPLGQSSFIASLIALPWIVWVRGEAFGLHAGYAASAAAVWLAAALLFASAKAIFVFEVIGALSLSLGATSLSQRLGWWRGNWFDWDHLYTQMACFAAWCLAWTTLRQSVATRSFSRRLFDRPWPYVDQTIMVVVVVGLMAAASIACVGGICHELGVTLANVAIPTANIPSHAWLALWLALAAITLSLWERANEWRFSALIGLGAVVPLFWSTQFDSELAVASSLRWGLAVYGLLVAVVISLRGRLLPATQLSIWRGADELSSDNARSLRLFGLLLTAIPVIAITTWTAILVSDGHAPAGPAASSWFARIGAGASFAIPLGLIAATCVLYAVRERQAWYMLTGSAVFQYFVTLAYLLPILIAGKRVDGSLMIACWQWNAAGLGLAAAAWVGMKKWFEQVSLSTTRVRQNHVLLQVQLTLAALATLLLSGLAAKQVFLSPEGTSAVVLALGAWPGYVACLATTVAVYLAKCRSDAARDTGRVWKVSLACTASLCLIALASASASAGNSPLNWPSYHVLMGGCLITCIGVVTYRCWLESNRVSATRFSMELASPALIKSESSLTGRAVRCASAWGIGIGTAVSLLAVSSSLSDPMRPLWQAGVAAALVGLAAAMAWFSHRHFFGYASIALTMLTITLVWLGLPSGSGTRTVWDLYTWNLSFAAVCASGWLAAEVWSQRRRQRSIFAAPDIVAAHRFVAGAGIILLLFGVSVMTAAGSLGVPGRIQPSGPNGILCTALFGLLLLGLLWDSRSRLGLAGLYVWGLAVESLVIDALGLDVPRGLLGMGCALATHSALTGALWRNGAKLVAIGDSLKIPDPLTGLKRTSHWLPVANFVASLLAGTIAFGGATGFGQRSLRIVAAFIPVFLAYGAAALAQKERRKWQQQLCLLWATAAAVLIGWADIEPQFGSADLLARAIRLLMVLSAVAFVYQLVILRWVAPASDWRMTLRRSSLIAAAAGLITLLCVMTLEVTIFFGGADRIVPVSDTQLIAVSLVLVGLIVALLASALSNERDPFALSERGRMTYVYGAQAAAGLLFAHIYLCRQMWFSGFMGPYWPYIVMAIAFGGVGSSELFRRQGIRVLAEPLERTGTFLPLLPAIGWWMLASKTDYSLLLFVIGLMYLLLSYTRKSHVSGIAAAVAGNGALWSLLFDRGFEPLHQPQLWLIPPAASILIAVELNRSRLPQTTQTALRYACLLVIYVSSTTEMFIRGIGDTLLPPIILLTLSLAGAFLGMILRIRAFLYLGSVFVFLSLTSMVWHASKSIDHIWPWWAFGIAVGIGVLIFFGVFEKRRDDVRRLASQLREWDK